MKKINIIILISIVLASCSKSAVEQDILEERAYKLSLIPYIPEAVITTMQFSGILHNDSTGEDIEYVGNNTHETNSYIIHQISISTSKEITIFAGSCAITENVYNGITTVNQREEISLLPLSKAIYRIQTYTSAWYSKDSAHYILTNGQVEYKTDRRGKVITNYNNYSIIYK